MTRLEAWLLHVSNLLVGVTGLVYAWMRYFAVPADEFAIVNHPLQPFFQHAHVLAAPLLVFGVGLVWQQHVAPRLRGGQRVRRRSGLVLALGLLPMVASGYLLQTASDERWRSAWIGVHLASSGLWTIAYVAHLVLGRQARVLEPTPLPAASSSRSRSASGTRG